MVEQIKRLRVEIDGLTQLCEGLNPVVIYGVGVVPSRHCGCCTEIGFTERKGNSEEIKEAIKSLKLSKAWLGKVLGSLGSENPYGSGYKTVEDIEPTADEHRGILHNPQEGEKPWQTKSHIEKVDWLRTEIKRLADILLEVNGGKLNQRTFSEYEEKLQWNAYSFLSEARFWLGFEMGRIRYESK